MKNRPGITRWNRPGHIDDYPVGPSFTAGHLVSGNAAWRTFRPVIDTEKCTGCLRCYLVCPDGTVFKHEGKVDVDLDFCKGCGVCAYECPVGVIEMVKEK